jgi:hypothetical protein
MWSRLKARLIRLFARRSFTQLSLSVAVDEPKDEERLLVYTPHR